MPTTPLTAPCATCDHKRHPDGGWCYMFRTPPTTVCLQHTATPTVFQPLPAAPAPGGEKEKT